MLSTVAERLGSLGIQVTPTGAGWLLAGLAVLVGLAALGLVLRGRVNLKVYYAGLAVTSPLLFVLGLGFEHDPHEIDSPLVGRPAPDFTLSPIDGGAPVHLAALRGQPAVVTFWATWCVPCQQEHRSLVAVARKLAGKVNFFGIVYQDEPAKIQSWLDRAGSAYPQLLDTGSKAAIAFGVYGVPETYIISPTGTITYKFTGPIEVSTLLAELAPMVPQ